MGAHPDAGNTAGAEADRRGMATDQHKQLVEVLDGIRRAQEDSKVHAPGTIGYIKRGVELDVYCTRGFDELKVEVTATLLGKDQFYGLKRACEHGKDLMIQIGWPTTITNRIAYGISTLSWGGKDHVIKEG